MSPASLVNPASPHRIAVPQHGVLIASLRFHPFLTTSTPPNDTISSTERLLRNLKHEQNVRIRKHFDAFLIASALSAHRTPTSQPTPAALAVMHLDLLLRRVRALSVNIDARQCPAHLTIRLKCPATPPSPQRVVRPNLVLQDVLWHHFRIAAQHPSNCMIHDDSIASATTPPCGFVGCDGACCPQPSNARLDFHIDRLYQRHTAAVRQQQSSQRRSFPPPTYSALRTSPLLSLADDVLHRVVLQLSASDIAALSRTCRYMYNFLLPFVPGLRLHLFPHQLHAIQRMFAMEKLHIREDDMPLLHRIDVPGYIGSCAAVDLVDGSILFLDGLPCVGPPRGGLFCDEPGLGKTITALALVLKTQGELPSPPVGYKAETTTSQDCSEGDTLPPLHFFREHIVDRMQAYGQVQMTFPDRKARLLPTNHGHRSIQRNVRNTNYLGIGPSRSLPVAYTTPDTIVYLSAATLIVVPTVLIDHWLSQIALHVEHGKLRILHIKSHEDLPDCAQDVVYNYDVVLVSFSVIQAIHEDMRRCAPVLLQIHFLRIIVDEGHSLSSTGTITNFMSVCQRLRAQNRWVMTGTPTLSSPRSDVEHLYSLLKFIREESFGLDRSAWEVAIQAPYSSFKRESLERLGSLLRRVMIRADKSILKVECSIENVVLDFSAPSAKSYNDLVRIVRRNLITSDWFSETHEESLLNPKNHMLATSMFTNLKLACCFGGTMNMSFNEGDVVEVLDLLMDEYRKEAGLSGNERFLDTTCLLNYLDMPVESLNAEDRALVDEVKRCEKMRKELLEDKTSFIRLHQRVITEGKKEASLRQGRRPHRSMIYSGRLHTIADAFLVGSCICDCCGRRTTIPMVTTCAHLLCDECIVTDRTQCVAKGCGRKYYLDADGVPEKLIELQPSASSDSWVKDWENTESAKLEYLVRRIENLPSNTEWEKGNLYPTLTTPKVIVHSEYAEHLQMVALRMKNSALKDRYVEMTLNQTEIATELKGLTASQIAERSVLRFRVDKNVNILLMNSRHGAVGLDLSFVQYIFLLEPVWDASKEQQIISRAYRIGCKRDITVERLVMRGSVEECMLQDAKYALRNVDIDVCGVAEARLERDRRRRSQMLRSLKLVKSGKDKAVGMVENGEILVAKTEEINAENGRGLKRQHEDGVGAEANNRPRRRVAFNLPSVT